MTFKIEPGERLDIQFGPFSAKAGVVDAGPMKKVAFFADVKLLRNLEIGTVGTVGDAQHRVVAASKSNPDDPSKGGVKGMIVLTVEPIA